MKTNNEEIKEVLDDIFEIPEFDYNKFRKEIISGDIWGLEYLEKTIIRDFKDRINDNVDKYTYYDYILNLFYATKCLNTCNDIYETSNVENKFDYDLYFDTKRLLLEELGFDVEKLYEYGGSE